MAIANIDTQYSRNSQNVKIFSVLSAIRDEGKKYIVYSFLSTVTVDRNKQLRFKKSLKLTKLMVYHYFFHKCALNVLNGLIDLSRLALLNQAV